ncbi:MAG: SurA N-terminal domain-containing protein [Bacteroidota bacterium]
MALIGKIRKNSWLLIILIGLGLASFIIMDMFSGNNGPVGGNPNTIGSVNGQEIGIREFNNAERIQQSLYGSSNANDAGFGRRNQLWDYFIEKTLVDDLADELGLTVTKEELLDLQFGPNPSPIIRSRYVDPNTGQFNPQQVQSFKTALESGDLAKDPRLGPIWAYQEKEIIKERLQTKINNMVAKGLYTPTWMAEKVNADQNQRVDFEYVQIPFDELDTDVELTDADFQSYLNDNKATYMQDQETRKIDYVVFDVVPTEEDSTTAKNEIVDALEDFRTTDDDSSFVSNKFGFYSNSYFNKDQMSAFDQSIVDQLWEVEKNTVIGPYIDQDAYRAIKLLDRKIIPDSVDSRHILRRVTQGDQLAFIQANAMVDSLIGVLNAGTTPFDTLAKNFSQDFSNANDGGDLGYSEFGRMVQPFNDVLFFTGEKGNYYKVVTQFGIHVLEILGKKYETDDERVKIAYLNQPIVPSEKTQNSVRNTARNFIRNHKSMDAIRKAVAEDDQLEIETASALRKNDYIMGALGAGSDSRQMIKWAYSAGKGDVSPDVYSYQDQVNYFDNKYVVIGLNSVVPAGMPSVADVREDIELQVLNRKKAEKVKEQISSTDLSAIAAKFNTELDTARNVGFTAGSIPGAGVEPKVLATAFTVDVNNISDPVIGNNGVYILKVINKPTSTVAANIPQIRQVENSKTQSAVRNNLMQAMKKNAVIEDFRSTFY